MTLWFDVVNSPGLSQEQKGLVLRVISHQTITQPANRELAVERFVEFMRDALRQVPVRKKTRVSKGVKLRRLEEKKQHGLLKSRRSKRVPMED